MTPPAIPTADIDLIRSELARAKPHITTMNFIVWIDRENNRDWVLQRAIKISEKHPSRTIILDASPGRIGAHVRPLDPNDPSQQSAFIDIGVAGISPQDACELATSLAVPDVLTVLCWSAERLGPDTAFRCFFAGSEMPVAVVDHGSINATASANQSAVRSKPARLTPGKIDQALIRGPARWSGLRRFE